MGTQQNSALVQSVLPLFENKRAHLCTGHKSIPLTIPGARRSFWVIVSVERALIADQQVFMKNS